MVPPVRRRDRFIMIPFVGWRCHRRDSKTAELGLALLKRLDARLSRSCPVRGSRPGLESDAAVAVVDERHGGDRIVGISAVGPAIAHGSYESLELLGVGGRIAAVLGPCSGAGRDDYPVVVLLVKEVGDKRFPSGSDHPKRHVPVLADHAAAREPRGAGGKLEVSLGPFVHPG